jgi:hypothetical protein
VSRKIPNAADAIAVSTWVLITMNSFTEVGLKADTWVGDIDASDAIAVVGRIPYGIPAMQTRLQSPRIQIQSFIDFRATDFWICGYILGKSQQMTAVVATRCYLLVVAKTLRNVGRLHLVNCEWCALKMACSCFFDEIRDNPSQAHPIILCPKCQVTEFLNLLFGKQDKARKRSIEI